MGQEHHFSKFVYLFCFEPCDTEQNNINNTNNNNNNKKALFKSSDLLAPLSRKKLGGPYGKRPFIEHPGTYGQLGFKISHTLNGALIWISRILQIYRILSKAIKFNANSSYSTLKQQLTNKTITEQEYNEEKECLEMVDGITKTIQKEEYLYLYEVAYEPMKQKNSGDRKLSLTNHNEIILATEFIPVSESDLKSYGVEPCLPYGAWYGTGDNVIESEDNSDTEDNEDNDDVNNNNNNNKRNKKKIKLKLKLSKKRTFKAMNDKDDIVTNKSKRQKL